MNKLNILFLGGLIAVGMVACDDKLPVAPPQANPQGPVLEGFEGAYASFLESSVDLPTAVEEGEDKALALYSVNAGSSELSQSDIWGELEISNTADFANSILLSQVNGMVGTVSLADLCQAHTQLFGISPDAKTVYYRILLFANVDGSNYRLGSLDSYGAQGTYSETYDPGYVLPESLYIIGVQGWDPADCVAMSHEEGVSVYEDPTFTYEFSSEGATYWKIVPPDVYAQVGAAGFDPNSDFWPFLYYPTDKTAKEGDLETGDAGKDSGEIAPGTWTISVNVKNWTYSISGTPAGMPDWIGTPNTFQDWTIGTSMQLLPYGDDYKGFSYFGGEWGGKLAYTLGGSDIWLGMANGTEPLKKDDDGEYYEISLADDGGNIFEGGEPEMYFISYSFPNKVAKFYPIVSCGIIGGFNDWGAQEPMTAVADSNDMKWSGTFTFATDTEFKFRFNDSWTINLGGDSTNLTVDGGNISAAAGTYEIVLDITNVPYSYTMTAK